MTPVLNYVRALAQFFQPGIASFMIFVAKGDSKARDSTNLSWCFLTACGTDPVSFFSM
jgi:hypothetical protein